MVNGRIDRTGLNKSAQTVSHQKYATGPGVPGKVRPRRRRDAIQL